MIPGVTLRLLYLIFSRLLSWLMEHIKILALYLGGRALPV
jgi:hypothetical protein